MSKTKNAFAFRDFDSSHILQRPFFKNFYFESVNSQAKCNIVEKYTSNGVL